MLPIDVATDVPGRTAEMESLAYATLLGGPEFQ
jgi:hypothetical protein